MKNLSEKQIRFLYKWNMIDPVLIAGWNKRAKLRSRTDPPYYVKRDLMELAMVRLLGTLLISALWLMALLKDHDFPLFVEIAVPLLVAIILKLFMRSEFARDLNQLNTLLNSGHSKKDRQISFIKGQVPDFPLTAELILSSSGEELESSETKLGVDSKDAKWTRRRFKRSHALLLKFDLCDEHQGKYLPRNRNKVSPEAPAPSAATA